MPRVPFALASRRDADNRPVSTERLVNLYPEPVSGRSAVTLWDVLGQEAFADIPTAFGGAVVGRAMAAVDGVLYVAASARLWSIASDGTVTNLAAISDDVDTFISGNGSDVTLTAGARYDVWDGSALSTVGGGRITDEQTVTFLGGYTVITDSNEFEWTDLGDPDARDALNFAGAESGNDALLRAYGSGDLLYLFGEATTEIWQTSGQSGADAFERLSTMPVGIAGARLVTGFDGGLFFVGDDGRAYLLNGNSSQPVSGPAVNSALADATPSHVFTYDDRGHTMLCIRFSDRPAWCFDLATGQWHERATGDGGAWEVIATARAYGNWYCLTTDGYVRRMARTATDINSPLIRVAVSGPYYADGRRFTVDMFEVNVKGGEADIGRDAAIMLRRSEDGRKWTPVRHLTIGGLGDMETKARFRALGQHRQFVAEVSISDPASITIDGECNLDLRGAIS